MKRRLHFSRRVHLRLTLLLVLSLLFQQFALAGYACSAADMRAGDAAMRAHCDCMPIPGQRRAPGLCAEHCAQQASTIPDGRSPTVPALLLPALLPATPQVIAMSTANTSYSHTSLSPVTGIPPALRFRILLI